MTFDESMCVHTTERYLVLYNRGGANDEPDEPIYPRDGEVRLICGDVVEDPRTTRWTLIRHSRAYTFFELMCLIHGAPDA